MPQIFYISESASLPGVHYLNISGQLDPVAKIAFEPYPGFSQFVADACNLHVETIQKKQQTEVEVCQLCKN